LVSRLARPIELTVSRIGSSERVEHARIVSAGLVAHGKR
jgi:hypothetical protein